MTERQEHIVREIGLELTRAKAKCKEPTQPDYIYWCGYRDALDTLLKARPNTRVTRC